MSKTVRARARKSAQRRAKPHPPPEEPAIVDVDCASTASGAMLPTRDGIAWSRQLCGSRHDKKSHIIARGAFLQLICRNDSGVAELFDWNGLLATAIDLAMRGDRLAARCDLQDRGEFFSSGAEGMSLNLNNPAPRYVLGEPLYDGGDGEPVVGARVIQVWPMPISGSGAAKRQPAPSIEAAFAAFAALRANFLAWEEDVCSCLRMLVRFAEPVERLVCQKWGLPWPWLVSDLAQTFIRTILAIIFNRAVLVDLKLEPPIPHVADLKRLNTLNLTPDLKRLLQKLAADGPVERATICRAVDCLLRELAQGSVARRGVRPKEATISRDVEWFYRTVVKTPKDTRGTLAREYYANHTNRAMLATRARGHRSTIDEGIKRAKYLLGDVPLFAYPLGRNSESRNFSPGEKSPQV